MGNCNGCTLCCKLLNIDSTNSPKNELCKHCEEYKGCTIYKTRPQECKEFNCAYAQWKKASLKLRPDKCGVIFERCGEDIFIGTISPIEKRLVSIAKRQIDSFLQEGFSVILFHSKIEGPYIQPAKGYTPKKVWKAFQTEVATISDSPNLSHRFSRCDDCIE